MTLRQRLTALERASRQLMPCIVIVRSGEDDTTLTEARKAHGDNLIIVRIVRAARKADSMADCQ